MEATKKSYPTGLTDDQWELVKELIPAAGTGGRKRSVDIRAILNAIFYIHAAGGCMADITSDTHPPVDIHSHSVRPALSLRVLVF